MTQQMQRNGNGAVQQQGMTIKDLLDSRKEAFASLMPKHVSVDRLFKVALNSIAKNPLLQRCTAASLFQAIVQAAELGLEPGGALGHAYLVPYKEVCQLIIGYRGFIELARRSGQLLQIEAHVVHEGDEFKVEFGLQPIMRHVPNLTADKPGRPLLAYMLARLKDGSVHCEVMTWAEVLKIRARSRAASSGPWVTDEEEMGKKTVVRRGMKYMPLSTELAKAMDLDDEDYVDAQVMPSLPADTQLATELTAPAAPKSAANEKAKAALQAKRPMVVDVPTGMTEEEALAALNQSEPPPPSDADAPATI